MDGIDLWNELNDLCNKLTVSGHQMKKYGLEKAEAEHDYKIALRQESLKLRSNGEAIGMIDKTVYGVPEVADKRFKRDVAETMYETSKESINALKLKIRILNEQLSREWQGGNNT